jgi:hypothetical protein
VFYKCIVYYDKIYNLYFCGLFMNVEDSDKVIDWRALRERINWAIENNVPNFFGDAQRAEVVRSEALNASSEPIKRRVTYGLYKGKEFQGQFTQTLIFGPNYEVQRIVDPGWAWQSAR